MAVSKYNGLKNERGKRQRGSKMRNRIVISKRKIGITTFFYERNGHYSNA
jgi:hypothetical protein